MTTTDTDPQRSSKPFQHCLLCDKLRDGRCPLDRYTKPCFVYELQLKHAQEEKGKG